MHDELEKLFWLHLNDHQHYFAEVAAQSWVQGLLWRVKKAEELVKKVEVLHFFHGRLGRLFIFEAFNSVNQIEIIYIFFLVNWVLQVVQRLWRTTAVGVRGGYLLSVVNLNARLYGHLVRPVAYLLVDFFRFEMIFNESHAWNQTLVNVFLSFEDVLYLAQPLRFLITLDLLILTLEFL